MLICVYLLVFGEGGVGMFESWIVPFTTLTGPTNADGRLSMLFAVE